MSTSASPAANQGEFQKQGRGRAAQAEKKPEGSPSGQPRGNGQGKGPKPKADGFQQQRKPRAEGAAPASPNATANGERKPKAPAANGERKPKAPAANGERKPKAKEITMDDPKLVSLKASTKGYFEDAVLLATLKEAKGDVDAALNALNAKKQSSWSSVVSKTQAKPFARVDAPAPAAAPAAAADAPAPAAAQEKPAPKEKAPKKEPAAAAPAPVVPAPAPVDPEKHIEALSKQIDESVRETESRAQQLKNIQTEIQSISGPRDAKIEQLLQDRSNLLARQQQIKEELIKIDSKVKEIDQEVEQIKREKIEKITGLEKKSKTLLAEMKR